MTQHVGRFFECLTFEIGMNNVVPYLPSLNLLVSSEGWGKVIRTMIGIA